MFLKIGSECALYKMDIDIDIDLDQGSNLQTLDLLGVTL